MEEKFKKHILLLKHVRKNRYFWSSEPRNSIDAYSFDAGMQVILFPAAIIRKHSCLRFLF